jgi:WD40 repeat protein
MNSDAAQARDEERFEEILAAYLEATDAGWAPNRQGFLARYPQWQRELEQFFAAQDEVASLAQTFQPPIPPPSSEMARTWTFRLQDGTNSDPTRTELMQLPGAQPVPTFGDYQLQNEIARGGMGIVYRARHISLNRPVALKMILAGRFASAAEVQRFRNEAEAAALMDHPGIVPIYEVGDYQGQPYFSMKLIEGGSLAEFLNRFTANPRGAVALVAEVARAVHYAHQRGILHRDLKPANILLDEQGRPVITDFGLAKRVEGDAGLTQSGAILGTPSYMAPEQAAAKLRELTTAVDVYALGAILYHLLTGKPPFKGDSPLDTLLLVRQQQPIAPRSLNRRIDRDLETICLKCLEKQPARRYATAADLASDLESWVRGEPVVCRPAGPLTRAAKWIRRRPMAATLGGLIFLVLALGCVGIGIGWELRQTTHAWRSADEERQRAEDQTALAESTLYINRVMRAQFEWQSNEVARAEQLLEECAETMRNWEWYYVKWQCHTEQLRLQGKEDGYSKVVFSSDGSRLISYSDNAIQVWDASSGQRCLTIPTGDLLTDVAINRDGSRLASASLDGDVKIWDARTGRMLHALAEHAGRIHAVCFNHDGQRLASACADHTIKIWDVAKGREVRTLKGHDGSPLLVTFSPDGERLASAGEGSTLFVWNLRTGERMKTYKADTGVLALYFSPDGTYLDSVWSEGTVRRWDLRAEREPQPLRSRRGPLDAATFSPDGIRLAWAAEDKTVNVWNLQSDEEILTLRGHSGAVHGIAFSPDGARLASASADGTVRVWDLRAAQQARTMRMPVAGVKHLAFSSDGHLLALASDKAEAEIVRVWDTRTGVKTLDLPGHAVCFSPDGQRLASAARDDRLIVWDSHSGREVVGMKAPNNIVNSVAFSPDGTRLATGLDEGMVRVWDWQAQREVLKLRGHERFVHAVCFSPDGSRLASAGFDATAKIWDAGTGEELHTLAAHDAPVQAVAFSPKGARLATASWDHTIKIWDTHTGQEMLTLKGHTHAVYAVAFSPDGTRLASASEDKTVKLWDARTGQETLTLKGHTGPVHAVAFSPDGVNLASASADGTVKVWPTNREPGHCAPVD